jgi:ubiquinone/menaquinone biosynthesis C-methylase UbiE
MYERLIQREDDQGNLLKAIEAILPTAGLDIIDLGAGTGRLGRLLAPRARSLYAFDTSAHMLTLAAESFKATGLDNWQVQVADHRQIPVKDASADLVVSGWSFSYLSVWGDRSQLEAGWSEVERVLRPGGTVILIESLGTGNPAPVRLEHLSDYYVWLDQMGFASRQIPTDYRFESVAEARELVGFFFGEQTAAGIETATLPEFSGLWWKKYRGEP